MTAPRKRRPRSDMQDRDNAWYVEFSVLPLSEQRARIKTLQVMLLCAERGQLSLEQQHAEVIQAEA